MTAIINQLDLTHQAKGVLYRAKPQIDDDAAFNKDCDPSQGDLELGCYYNGRIYVLQITNPTLASEMTVVTAHELLHAEYARYPTAEKNQLTTELEQAYTQVAAADLAARMADYAKSEPGERDNELHSILGTEFPNLPADLEAHYRLYFVNRSIITNAHAAYQAVFNTQLDQINAELAQINSLKDQLTSLDDQLDADKAAGAITTYNSLIPQQNALVDQVNGLIAQYQSDVAQYNELSVSLESEPITPANVPTVQ